MVMTNRVSTGADPQTFGGLQLRAPQIDEAPAILGGELPEQAALAHAAVAPQKRGDPRLEADPQRPLQHRDSRHQQTSYLDRVSGIRKRSGGTSALGHNARTDRPQTAPWSTNRDHGIVRNKAKQNTVEQQLKEFEQRLRRQLIREKMDNALVQESFETGSMPQIHVSLGALAASAPPTAARVSGD